MVRGGEIVAEAYAAGITPDKPSMGWSLGKSLNSLMIGWLQRRGLVAVSENDPFAQWDDDRVKISAEDLLHMSSGLDFDEVNAPISDATRMLLISAVAAGLPLQSALAEAPSTHIFYSSDTTNLLTLLFNGRVCGPQNALNHLYQDILWPLGMRHTTVEPDANGVFVGSSNICASALNWARLG